MRTRLENHGRFLVKDSGRVYLVRVCVRGRPSHLEKLAGGGCANKRGASAGHQQH